MQCVIPGENPVNFFSCEIYKWYKNPSSALASKIADHKSDKWAGMENQENTMEAPFDVEKITADDINMDGMEGIEERYEYR